MNIAQRWLAVISITVNMHKIAESTNYFSDPLISMSIAYQKQKTNVIHLKPDR